MSFIDTINPAAAQGAVRDMYQRQQRAWGYVPNYAKVFCHRPEVMARWGRLLAEIRRPMSDRRFELVAFTVAHELKNTACALEHGRRLASIVGEEAVLALAAGKRVDAVDESEAAIADFSRKVAVDAVSVTARDVEELKAHGLSDAEIFDVAAAAAGRAFFTKVLDGLGVQADCSANAAESLGSLPMVGRPVSTEGLEYVEETEQASSPEA